ncbi:hypothetical protein KGF57_002875 [Candida theae]|uniref:Swi5-domain-containing protein n=1 Tax=Candida theae TaxID=1198502 RepID=A0AAD5FYH5_9ASCO|nr:uncharacterized protein KGF57_002875 [Candida theae]KAI5958067.1 hypothetical protein KGF57_002875 [Candida theae]
MSDTVDHENSLLESTTKLVIDNDEAGSNGNSHSQIHPHQSTRISTSLPSSSESARPQPQSQSSSEESTCVGNSTVVSSINTEPRQLKLQNSSGEGETTIRQTLDTQAIDTTVPILSPSIGDKENTTKSFAESLSTSPTSPSAYTAPRESFKSHSATSSTSTLSPEDQERISTKEKNLDEIKQQCSCLIHELEGNDQPEVIVKRHIQQLKKYNELKDVALQLVTLIADQRQVKTTDILNEMKLEVGEDGNEV